ncbi:unnamed protein product [Phytomonas sp. Hart1]|nr:unnamed protein product [Phytomonas sp. Hart1]|eukprot:CCW68851.1 unnamed protein product [Phytomonas sp. isolate Hart1]
MSNQYHNKNILNSETESPHGNNLHMLTGSLVGLCYYPTTNALSSLRGDPDYLTLLNIIHHSVRCLESEIIVSDSKASFIESVHSDDILHSLCKLLVYGSDTTVQTDTDKESLAYEYLPNRANAIQNNDNLSTEERNVSFLFFNWRKNIQLVLPLYSPSMEFSTLRLARQIVRELDWSRTLLLSGMIIPLFKRWQSEERLQLLELQQQGFQCLLSDAEEISLAPNPPRAEKQIINLKGSYWMKELLETIATCLMEQMIQCLVGTYDKAQEHSCADDLVDMLGLLSKEVRSYRTLCAGATALLGYQWVELAQDVQQYFISTSSKTMTFTVSGSSASVTIADETVKSKDSIGWLWQHTVVQQCAWRHAHELWRRWVRYFSKYDYTSRKTGLCSQREAEGNLAFTSATGLNVMETPQKNDTTSSAVLTESQWLFLKCLVLHTQDLLQIKKGFYAEREINVRNNISGSTMDRFDAIKWALQSFSRRLLEIFQDIANAKLDLYIQENLSLIDASSFFSPSHNRLIIRDYFWKTIQQTELEAAKYSKCLSHPKNFWSSLFLVYGQLTAIQAPNEETVVGSLTAIGDSSMSVHNDSHHMLEDVLNSIQKAYHRCSERSLHESWHCISNIVKGSHENENQTKGRYIRIGGKRQRSGSPILERDTKWKGSLAWDTPDSKLNRYLSRVFYSVYHPSCFQLLLLERQKQLSTLLFELHSLLVVDDHCNLFYSQSGQLPTNSDFSAVDSTGWHSSDDDEESVGQDARVAEVAPCARLNNDAIFFERLKICPTRVACRLLARDARLTLMLSHAVLLLLERRGRVAGEVGSVLTAVLIPTLVTLSTHPEIEEALYDSNPHSSEHHSANRLNRSNRSWRRSEQATFCLYALIHSEFLMALPWSVEGVYLTMARYRDFTRYLLKRYWGEPDTCISQLEEWTKEGGGAAVRNSTTSIGNLCDSLDNFVILHDPVLRQLKNRAFVMAQQRQHEQGVTASSILDECVRRVTPLFIPPPCGTLLVLAFSRRLFQKMYSLRNAYKMQQHLVEGDNALEYLGRRCIFCIAEDIEVFKVIVRTAHRMIFATRLQPMGLLQLWIGMLAHLFTHVVPMEESDEGMELMPRSWQLRETELNCFSEKVHRTGWRALRPSSRGIISSQTTLRVILGEQLAELFLMPMSDPSSSLDCPHAFPIPLHSPESKQEQLKSQMEVQCVFPHAVLEVLCLFLKVNTNVSNEELARLSTTVAIEASGGFTTPLSATPAIDVSSSTCTSIKRLEENSFLGLAGLVALCRQIERKVVAGTLKDVRLVHLLRCIWAVADLSALEW